MRLNLRPTLRMRSLRSWFAFLVLGSGVAILGFAPIRALLLSSAMLTIAAAPEADAADAPAVAVNERLPLSGAEAGKAVFLSVCAACHQPTGVGDRKSVV